MNFYRTYDYPKVISYLLHPDIKPHLMIDGLPEGEELEQALLSWLPQTNNYIVLDGVKPLGVINYDKISKTAVEMHLALIKDGWGRKSRQILLEFFKKLGRDNIKTVYAAIPANRLFANKLARDVGFNVIDDFSSFTTIDGEEVNMTIYKREI